MDTSHILFDPLAEDLSSDNSIDERVRSVFGSNSPKTSISQKVMLVRSPSQSTDSSENADYIHFNMVGDTNGSSETETRNVGRGLNAVKQDEISDSFSVTKSLNKFRAKAPATSIRGETKKDGQDLQVIDPSKYPYKDIVFLRDIEHNSKMMLLMAEQMQRDSETIVRNTERLVKELMVSLAAEPALETQGIRTSLGAIKDSYINMMRLQGSLATQATRIEASNTLIHRALTEGAIKLGIDGGLFNSYVPQEDQNDEGEPESSAKEEEHEVSVEESVDEPQEEEEPPQDSTPSLPEQSDESVEVRQEEEETSVLTAKELETHEPAPERKLYPDGFCQTCGSSLHQPAVTSPFKFGSMYNLTRGVFAHSLTSPPRLSVPTPISYTPDTPNYLLSSTLHQDK